MTSGDTTPAQGEVTGYEFSPDWTLAPAAVLAEWMREHNVSTMQLAIRCTSIHTLDYSFTRAARLITEVLDRHPLTVNHSRALYLGTKIPEEFWLAFEKRYRDDLAAGRQDVTTVGTPAAQAERQVTDLARVQAITAAEAAIRSLYTKEGHPLPRDWWVHHLAKRAVAAAEPFLRGAR